MIDLSNIFPTPMELSESAAESDRRHQRLLEQLEHQKRARELLVPTEVRNRAGSAS